MDRHFFSRVTSIPVVSSAICQAESVYLFNKHRNTLTEFAFGAAEFGLKVAVATAQPVLSRLEQPICVLNAYACDRLSQLESNFPAINTPTDQVLTLVKRKIGGVLLPVNFEDDFDVENLDSTDMNGKSTNESGDEPCCQSFDDKEKSTTIEPWLEINFTLNDLLDVFIRQIYNSVANKNVSTKDHRESIALMCHRCLSVPSSSDTDVACLTCSLTRNIKQKYSACLTASKKYHPKELVKSSYLSLVVVGQHLYQLFLTILDWLSIYSPLIFLVPECNLGSFSVDDDDETQFGNGVIGYVPIHPADLFNLLALARPARVYWRRRY